MIIIYKSYKSSFLATFISSISSIAFVSCIGGIILFFKTKSSEDIVLIIVSLVIGICLRLLAKNIAQRAHVQKLCNNLKYAKEFVNECPEAHEFCMANNYKYAEEYRENIGQSNFDPNEYTPC